VGTDFTVRSYSDDDYVQLVVVSGTVAMESRIGNGKREKVLTNGQMGLLNKMTGELTVRQVDADRYLGWMDGRIIFDETPLSQVSRDLERWFGIDMEIGDTSLENLRLTAELSSRSLSHVLSVISHTLEVEYEMDDDRVLINKSPVKGNL
jgi:transmembrane sensor